jgi:hypothetical protein
MTSFKQLLLVYAVEEKAVFFTPKKINSCEQTATGFRVEIVPEDQTYQYPPETVNIPLEDLLGYMWGKISEVKK